MMNYKKLTQNLVKSRETLGAVYIYIYTHM